ncbi:hypothetical protein V6N11_026380 [Hibiscus sabdariffa]|uniref:Uncharacterized protein n=1 Tax=Hibiscus sabdariffa TaxID=183260 RepID=A0ABR2SWC4_9ROSI
MLCPSSVQDRKTKPHIPNNAAILRGNLGQKKNIIYTMRTGSKQKRMYLSDSANQGSFSFAKFEMPSIIIIAPEKRVQIRRTTMSSRSRGGIFVLETR